MSRYSSNTPKRFVSIEGWLERRGSQLFAVSKTPIGIEPTFNADNGYFYRILRGWETVSGFYVFALTVADNNGRFLAFLQLKIASFGPVSMESFSGLIIKGQVWEILSQDLPHSGVDEKPVNWNDPI